MQKKKNYRVKTYCDNPAAKSASELDLTNQQYSYLKALFADSLACGASAQEYIKYNTSAPVDTSTWIEKYKTQFKMPTGIKTVAGNSAANNKGKSTNLNISNVNKIFFCLVLTNDNIKILLNDIKIDRSTL